jgi:hypothetical protein
VARRHADVVDGGFAVGRRVEGATEALHRLRERARRRIGPRSLERQVLHEMCAPGLAGSLVARAREDVRLHGEGAGARQPRGDDAGPVGQRRSFEHRGRVAENDTLPDAGGPSSGSRTAILGARSHPVTGPIAARHASPVARPAAARSARCMRGGEDEGWPADS